VYFTIGLVTIIGLAAKDAIPIIEFALTSAPGQTADRGCDRGSYCFGQSLTGLAFAFGVAPMVIASGASP
jgi:multidrug efflux pump